MNVESIADNPALISGSGTPITGKKPSVIPILMNIWNVMAVAIDIITSIPGRSEASRAPSIKREINKA